MSTNARQSTLSRRRPLLIGMVVCALAMAGVNPTASVGQSGGVIVDTFPNSTGFFTLVLDVLDPGCRGRLLASQAPPLVISVFDLHGPTTVHVFTAVADRDGNGLDDVQTEIVALNLTGSSNVGPITISLSPSRRSLGLINEGINNVPGTLEMPPLGPYGGFGDSYFDVFFEVTIEGVGTFHNEVGARMQARIDRIPPRPEFTVYAGHFPFATDFFDANNQPVCLTTAFSLHVPGPPVVYPPVPVRGVVQPTTPLPFPDLSDFGIPTIAVGGLPKRSRSPVPVPAVDIPSVSIPSVRIPSVSVPSVSIPSVRIPSVSVPSVSVPGPAPAAGPGR